MTIFGQRCEIPPFTGRVHPDYNKPDFLPALADLRSLSNAPSSRILLDSRNRVAAVSIPLDGGISREIVVKEFRAKGLKKAKTLILSGKARRAWLGAAACVERRVPTPLPLAYLERRSRGVVAESYFVSEYLDGAVEIRGLLRTPASDDLVDLLRDLARFLLFCHNQGIFHRDLSDGNILVRESTGRGRRLFLIDTNRIAIRRQGISTMARVKNLIRLGVPPEYRDFFLTCYLGESRRRPFLRFWYRLNKNSYAGYIGFKKKLRLRRLAEKLGIG